MFLVIRMLGGASLFAFYTSIRGFLELEIRQDITFDFRSSSPAPFRFLAGTRAAEATAPVSPLALRFRGAMAAVTPAPTELAVLRANVCKEHEVAKEGGGS